jgi:hypothetical protein
MITKLAFGEINALSPVEAVARFHALEKCKVKEMVVSDVLGALDKPFIDTYYRDVFPAGVYLFFDEDNYVKYIGQSGNGFFNRMMSQLDPTPSDGWGWNVLLKKMGTQRLGKRYDELTEEDHWHDLEILEDFGLVFMELEMDGIANGHHRSLERILLKSFREIKGERLLNTGIGWLQDEHWSKSIGELLKYY